jgi:hypothetical protein
MSEPTCNSEYLKPAGGTVRCEREAGHRGPHMADQGKLWEARQWWPEHEVKR